MVFGSIAPVLQAFQTLKAPKLSLSMQVITGMCIGIAIGLVFPAFGVSLQPLSTLFIRMIKMIIAPLIFSSLVVGIAGTGGGKALGRMGLKTLLYFQLCTIPALMIGLTVANVLKPGAGLGMDLLSTNGDVSALDSISGSVHTVQHQSLMDTVVHLVPTSIVDAMAQGDILQVVVFSVFFALALIAAGDKGKPLLNTIQSLADVMFKLVDKVMIFAPMGVTAAIAATVGKSGLGVLLVYAKLVGSLYFALALFVGLVLVSSCAIARIPFLRLVTSLKEAILLAFSTASSESALPKAMEILEKLGVPKNVVSFVLPTGYSFNLDGSSLYLSLASIFIAQLAGIEMSAQQQLLMLLTLVITTKGVAAVPRASLVVLTATLSAFGLPLEGVAVILGIDHFLDMGRTTVNLLGNCVAAAVIARWEGVLDDQKMLGVENFEKTESDRLPGFEPRIA